MENLNILIKLIFIPVLDIIIDFMPPVFILKV